MKIAFIEKNFCKISLHFLLFLTLYITTIKMADQAPALEPRDIPEIRLRTEFHLKLTDHQGFTVVSRNKFKRLSVNDKQRLLLQLPIPAIIKHTGGQSTSSSQKSKSSSRRCNNRSEHIPAELVASFRNRGGEFTIEGRKFAFEYSSYEYVNQFLAPIWKKNQISEDDFFSRYIRTYLVRPVSYAKLYFDNDEQDDVDELLTTFQSVTSSTHGKTEVERTLQRCLYNPIEKPLLESLEYFKTQNIPKEGLAEYLNGNGVGISPPLDLNTTFVPFFNTTHNSDLKMLGVSTVPDACLGYYIDEDSYMAGLLVGYVGVETPTFDLEDCYKRITGDLPDSDIHFDDLGTGSLQGKTSEFLKTIRKYCTMCVHTGCDRFILVDYDSYLFVHLDENVSLMQNDEQEEILHMTASPLLDAENSEIQGEEGRGESSTCQMTDVRMAGKGRKEKSKTQGSEAPKLQSSNIDNTSADSNSSFPLHLIAGRHFWVSRKHPNVRLYVLAFLAMNKGRWDELRSFRENVIALMTVEKEKTEREEEARHNTHPGSQSSSAKRQKTGSDFMALSCSGDDSYYFEKNIFEDEYKIDFGPIHHSLLRVAAGMHSQVISIYSKKFIEKLSPIHPIFGKEIPDISVLKIFDPLWGKDVDDDRDYTYPDGVAMCIHELKVYEKLKDLMGSYIPWIFSYGRIVDIHVTSGQWYPRFWGSFIHMEYIEPDRTFAEEIPLEFVHNSIIPVYEKLHKCGVVQNDFKVSNFIITGDQHEVKIIDFSSAIITNDENLFKKEISDIKRYFNIPI